MTVATAVAGGSGKAPDQAHRGFVKEKGSFFAHGATRLFRGGVERGPPGEAFPGGELSPNSVNINLQFS